MDLEFSIEYRTQWGESLHLVTPEGRWPMEYNPGGIWTLRLKNAPARILDNYGYVLMRDGICIRSEWEDHHRKAGKTARMSIKDSWLDCPVPGCPFERKHSAAFFDTPGFRGAGTAIPVFSLRSGNGFGVGEFLDIPAFVDWMAETGQHVLQLLPINDTTRKGEWSDSYPYNPVSAFALHPIYLNLPDAGVEEDESYLSDRHALNGCDWVDYPKVMSLKLKYLRRAYDKLGSSDLGSAGYKRFEKQNSDWLTPYAEFCARRDGAPAGFYRWVQFHLDRQLGKAVAYAHSKGVFLKGDLPIGVGRDSVDAWQFPKLFNLDSSAGAPPDYFSSEGQNWGFPTYNWEEMAKDGYAWWKARLRNMSRFFDAFRIDHILGFFRIWEIPLGERSGAQGHFNPALPYSRDEIEALDLPLDGLFHEDPRRKGFFQPLISPDTGRLEPWGKERFDRLYNDFFYHRHNAFWERNAMLKLPWLLNCTGMLACGEDLGMVPDCVPGVMEREKILTLEMQRMQKGHPWPVLSVAATSSHDMSSIRMWDAQDKSPEECRKILRDHLDSCAMLAIFPLQDWLSMDGDLRNPDAASERINEPADPDNKWRWRMHLPINRLRNAASFREEVTSLIKNSGR